MKDLMNLGLIKVKGGLFLILRLLSATTLALQVPNIKGMCALNDRHLELLSILLFCILCH